MKLLAAFALGVLVGILLVLGPQVQPEEPAPARILSVVDERGLDEATCRANAIAAKWEGWSAQRATPCECEAKP